MPKIIVIGLGSAINIAKNIVENSTATPHLRGLDISVKHIDTSHKSETPDIPLLIVGDGLGSGGRKVARFNDFKVQKNQIDSFLEVGKEPTMYVICTGTAGGTSAGLNIILDSLKMESKLMVVAENHSTAQARKNTYKTLQGLINWSKKNGSLPIFNIDNDNQSYAVVNKWISNEVGLLLSFFTTNMRTIDFNDMLNFMRPDSLIDEEAEAFRNLPYKFETHLDYIEESENVYLAREVVTSPDSDLIGQEEEIGGDFNKQGHFSAKVDCITDEGTSAEKVILTQTPNYWQKYIRNIKATVAKDEQNKMAVIDFDDDGEDGDADSGTVL